MADQVITDRVVFAGHECNAQFRADAIGGRDKNGLLHRAEIRAEHPSERADLGQYIGSKSLAGQFPDAVLGSISRIDIDSCFSVADSVGHIPVYSRKYLRRRLRVPCPSGAVKASAGLLDFQSFLAVIVGVKSEGPRLRCCAISTLATERSRVRCAARPNRAAASLPPFRSWCVPPK